MMRYEIYQNLDGWYFAIDTKSDKYKVFLENKPKNLMLVATFIDKEMAFLMEKVLNSQD